MPTKEARAATQRRYRAKQLKKRSLPAVKNKRRRGPVEIRYLGVDGEGQGRDLHKYVFLAASTEDGLKTWSVESASWRAAWCEELETYTGIVRTLSTRACLDFLLALPQRDTKAFSYAFNYDLTKILEDLPNSKLYLLFRPELRPPEEGKEKYGPQSIRFGDYRLNLQGTKFTVQTRSYRLRRVVWDIFKFYQSKFVGALKDWKVGDDALYDRMTQMKDKRGEFDKESPDDVTRYCLEECRCMAELAHKLVTAHEGAELPLKSFYGAGSSGASMLLKMGIDKAIIPPPEEMLLPIAKAFFGGRFENSEIGPIRQTLYGKDISSAYPYQIYFLPCLLHGTWRHTRERADLNDHPIALVHYGLAAGHHGDIARYWGPFPFREEDGSICFPSVSGGGWVYAQEYLAGEALFAHVHFREAWIYQKNCDCHPFKEIAQYYLYRLKIGKEGPGIVIKLAVNSCYGKLAQSVGNARFNSWLWAGIITSGCRAQILRIMECARHLSDLVMIATDGIASKKPLPSLIPLDTGTHILLNGERNTKPLGGWEDKPHEKGLFLARPGIYFPLDPTEAEIKDVKGRGVGKATILRHNQKIVESWERYGVSRNVEVANISRFCGAKTSLSRSGVRGKREYHRADGSGGPNAPSYGNWIERSVEMSFAPMPKRECVNEDGRTLRVREISTQLESHVYDRVLLSPDAQELRAAAQELLEQPDGDYAWFGLDDEEEMNL